MHGSRALVNSPWWCTVCVILLNIGDWYCGIAWLLSAILVDIMAGGGGS